MHVSPHFLLTKRIPGRERAEWQKTNSGGLPGGAGVGTVPLGMPEGRRVLITHPGDELRQSCKGEHWEMETYGSVCRLERNGRYFAGFSHLQKMKLSSVHARGLIKEALSKVKK